MTTSERRKVLREELGYPFTTKGKVKTVMGYAKHHEVTRFFSGLPKVQTKFFTDDVIDRIMGAIEYEED